MSLEGFCTARSGAKYNQYAQNVIHIKMCNKETLGNKQRAVSTLVSIRVVSK